MFDVVTAVWARNKSKIYTDTKIAELSEGLTYKGSVPTVGDLPTSGNVKGDCYNVTDGSGMYAWNGTSWGKASMAGPKGDKGDPGEPGPKGSDVSVSPTGTSTNEVNYITIDGVESKLAGGSDVSVSATGTSTNQVKYITIDGAESKFSTEAFKPMKSAWMSSSLTTAQAAAMILADPEVAAGDAFSGGVNWNDLYTAIGLGNGEATARVGDNKDFILFTMSSSDTAPYEWNWNSYAGKWRSYVPINDTLTGTSNKEALSANQGKQLKTLVDTKSSVSVSATGTSTDRVKYITVNGTEKKMAQLSDTEEAAVISAVSTSGLGWREGTPGGEVQVTWDGNTTGKQQIGTAYLITSTTPTTKAELYDCVVTAITEDGPTTHTFTQEEIEAGEGTEEFLIFGHESVGDLCVAFTDTTYMGFNVAKGIWFNKQADNAYTTGLTYTSTGTVTVHPIASSYLNTQNNVTSTSPIDPLSANMGKVLQDQITNLQNIGRFLSVWNASTGKPTSEPTTLPYSYRTGDYYRVGVVNTGYYIHQMSVSGTTTDSKSYTATFGFISDSKSSITRFNQVVNQLYILGYRSYATGLETSASIGASSYTDGFVTSESGQLRFYDNSGVEVGRAANGTTVTDNVSAATIHSIYAHGYDVASKEYYIDFSFPSTSGSAYTTIGQVAEVLVKLHYSQAYPCSASGTCGSGGSVHFVYGTGSTLVLLDVNMLEIGRITTLETPSEFTDATTGSEAPNYRPDGSTYTGTASTVVETEELEVGAVYYFDSGKWVLQKSGGGGLVQDVQINGNTILDLNSGIANIPIGGLSTLGVVKASGNGISILSDGQAVTNLATNADLEGKSNLYKPVVPANLDKSVMEGLGNNSLTWTDEYKSSARNTIGAGTPVTIEFLGEDE